MRAVVQRVRAASVTVDGRITGRIDRGLLVYLGVGRGDADAEVRYTAQKIATMRVFADADGRMNLSLGELEADEATGILLVSQFTLYGDVRKGRRPSYNEAAEPEVARRLYESTADALRVLGHRVETGVFGAHMDVSYTNDGPVTIIVDTDTRTASR